MLGVDTPCQTELGRMKLEDLNLRELFLVAVVSEEIDEVTPLAEKPELLLVNRRDSGDGGPLRFDLVPQLLDALIRIGENVVELEVHQEADGDGNSDDRHCG